MATAQKKPAITPAEGRAAARSLRAFWAAGARFLAHLAQPRALNRDDNAHGDKERVLTAQAAALGVNADTLRKAARAAAAYTAADVDALCRLVEATPARFAAAHLAKAMSVPDRAARDRLIRAAIRGRWSVGELSTALKARRGRRAGVGKRPYIPRAGRLVLVALDDLCLKFVRWVEAARTRLPGHVGGEAEAAAAAVRRVRDRVAAELSPPARPKNTRDTPKGGPTPDRGRHGRRRGPAG